VEKARHEFQSAAGCRNQNCLSEICADAGRALSAISFQQSATTNGQLATSDLWLHHMKKALFYDYLKMIL
jgi:hypothetical protein